MPWDEHRPYRCAMCTFRASACGIRAGRTPSTARQPAFNPWVHGPVPQSDSPLRCAWQVMVRAVSPDDCMCQWQYLNGNECRSVMRCSGFGPSRMSIGLPITAPSQRVALPRDGPFPSRDWRRVGLGASEGTVLIMFIGAATRWALRFHRGHVAIGLIGHLEFSSRMVEFIRH
jgi:hypothetical protein